MSKRRSRRQSDEPDLMVEIRVALGDPSPLPLLALASSLMAVMDPRRHPLDTRLVPPRDELVTTFLDVNLPETTALLSALLVMIDDDDLLRARIRRELAVRAPADPPYLAMLPDTVVYRAVRMTHILGDGDNIFLGVRFPGGHELTAVIYIDHNMGTVVKDGFAVPLSIADLVAQYEQELRAEGIDFEDIDLAHTRTCIEDGIKLGSMFHPPLESESWPASRALIEWLTRRLPDGGAGYVRPQWDSDDRDRLAERFFASPQGVGLDDPDHRGLLEALLWYAVDYGAGDPTRWSAQRVEILFADWLPRKVMAPAEYLALAPELTRAFIEFVHQDANIPDDLTDEVLAAVDEEEPAFLDSIGADAPEITAGDWVQWAVDDLAKQVGGADTLAALDVSPLPDEGFDWSDVPADITEQVGEVLVQVDQCCNDLLDTQYRTVCRRVLARVAGHGSNVFRRRGSTVTAAAAVVWIAGKANGLFDHGGPMTVKALSEYFGITSSPSTRGATMLRAGGFRDDTYHVTLGSPEYLVASKRESLLAKRDRLQAQLGR